MSNLTAGITGSDGHVPIYEPDGRWTTWNLNELYLGTVAAGRYIPKVNDYVVNIETDERYIVVALNPTTLVPTLKKLTGMALGTLDEIDILLGIGPGTQKDTYRVYIDNSVIPHTLAVDARLKVNGSMAKTAKLFKGSALNGTQAVISAFYDQSGTLLGQSIPLELVALPEGVNYAVKSVPVCYTTQELADGEIITAVFYSDDGHVVSKQALLAENTAFIRTSDTAVKYITSISLKSPFLSNSDPTLIQYPINVPLAGLNLIGVVHYSDGTTIEMPVDGTKFEIFGLQYYVATIVGQKIPLVLNYNLSPNEIVYGATIGADKYITANYRATTTQANGAYSVKLFGYPVWIDAINGYRLEWFLYNLDRQISYLATPYVTINPNTHVFNPLLYGVNQRMSVSVNLKDVNGVYTSYIHVQTIDIALLAPGTAHNTNWTVGFDPNQNPPFGVGNYAQSTFVNTNIWKLKLNMGLTSQSTWLERLYSRTKPLVDQSREIEAPAPDFFALVFGVQEIEFPISQWNAELTISNAVPDGATVFVKFFKRTVDNDIQLGIAALPVYQLT